MNDSVLLKFLYNTAAGRMLLKLLVHPGVSKAAGRYLSSRASGWLVPYYIRRHNIRMDDIDIPKDGFASFNEFFTRKKKGLGPDGYRFALDARMISPCEGFLSVETITDNSEFLIKHTVFSLDDLLKNHRLAAKFRGGTALIFRLMPANYHRYCYAADGKMIHARKIPGVLHCVRPIALRSIPVFTQNSREYQVIRTHDFGTMIQMEVGALLVGKISNASDGSIPAEVRAGDEKGYFEFGGSTIIVLVREGVLKLPEKFYNNTEIPVDIGESISF